MYNIPIYELLFSTIASNVDYTTTSDEIVFAVGEHLKNITIPILADLEMEEEEIFYVELATDCCIDVITERAQVNITNGIHI